MNNTNNQFYEIINIDSVPAVTNDHRKILSIQPLHELILKMQTDLDIGITTNDANNRRRKYGLNELADPPKQSFFSKIKEQFNDLLVRLLLIAAIVSFIISAFGTSNDNEDIPVWIEPLVIFIILILNATIGIYQDYSADNALEALKELQNNEALVLRDNSWSKIKSRFLVPGDIVKITQGDKIPADMRIAEILSTSLAVDESILTGESDPVIKTVEINESNTTDEEIFKGNMVYSGTLLNEGTAICIVIHTGMKTEIGSIQETIMYLENKEDETPLTKKLDEFGNKLAKIIGLICISVWILNIKKFNNPILGGILQGALYYFKIAVSLAVAAIPEGLPAIITTTLALGTRRMAKENAIIRKLTSVETLGCTTVICTDKTGTLTTSQMNVKKFLIMGNKENDVLIKEVTGLSFNPEGDILGLNSNDMHNENMRLFCECMSLNNGSKLLKTMNKVEISGSPTEAAIRTFVEKLGKLDPSHPLNQDIMCYNNFLADKYEVLANLQFNNKRRAMSILCYNKTRSKYYVFTKGGADVLLSQCNSIINQTGKTIEITQEIRQNISNYITQFCSEGLRTIGICYKEISGPFLETKLDKNAIKEYIINQWNANDGIEDQLTFVGLVGLRDPPRAEAKEAIDKCKKAGISVIMMTGDHKLTAECIGKEIGIINNDELDNRSLLARDFENMPSISKSELLVSILKENGGMVISRSDPIVKKNIVQYLKNLGQIVAMTGDGVNDAPALRQADIGISMGICGTSIAKEASKMILADDNFATIVKAVEEGRAIYCNMKSFIRYMISSNIGEVLSILFTTLLSIPDGFNSIQLLWVNLITDGLPAAALSFNPPTPDIMNKPPRKNDEPIITKWVFLRYMIIGTYIGFATVMIFIYWYIFYDWSDDGHTLVTMSQLMNWSECPNWQNFNVNNFGMYNFTDNACSYFIIGKQKASTLSLSVLVIIEMVNSLNALSDDASILQTGLFINKYLIIAILFSILSHCFILYIPTFQHIFNVVQLNTQDWILVISFSIPVLFIDEFLKYLIRRRKTSHRKNSYTQIEEYSMHSHRKDYDIELHMNIE